MNQVPEITLKSTFPKKFDFSTLIGKDVLMVGGQALGYKVHPDTGRGESIMLSGAFVGVNLTTGEAFESSTFYPSKDFAFQVYERLKAGEVVVEFKAKFALVASAKTVQGYAWVTRPILDADTKSRHEELKLAVMAQAKELLLAAPTATVKGKAKE
jgi:hypothetical protein